jgi:DMSO/TMAO reductase YedYZ molybdopterin-dependent catalytic subunit
VAEAGSAAAVALPVPVERTPVPPELLGPPPVPGQTAYLPPTADFYRIDTALVSPRVDARRWRLRVSGLVDRPFELTFDQLLALPMVERPVTLSCVSNEVGGDLVGNAVWLGVPLADLLERAGVQPGAEQVVGESVDGFTAGFPVAAALDGRDALVAVGMNGEPLPVRHGYPARLVVEGLYGYVSATKWLQEIRLNRWSDEQGYWVPRGWAREAPVKTQSRIDVPGRGDVRAGTVAVAGVAWAPGRGISAVEVSVDGVWRPARLLPTASDATWVQWVMEWDAAPGQYLLRVRATDGTGEVQTGETARPDPDGATGWHARSVTVV